MFLNPEVAGVGKNEKTCRAEGIAYKVCGNGLPFL